MHLSSLAIAVARPKWYYFGMNRFIMRPLGYLCHLILRQMEGYNRSLHEIENVRLKEDNRDLRATVAEQRAEVRVGETEKELLAGALERYRTQAERDIALFLREAKVEPPPTRRRGG